MIRVSRIVSTALTLAVVGASAVPPSSAASSLAGVAFSSSLVSWEPLTDQPAVLTVSGPQGVARYDLAAGEPFYFSCFDGDGELLPDGSYTWEMRSEPVLLPDKVLREGLAQSGHFRILDGAFVTARQEEGGDKDVVFADDAIIVGSSCIGFNCVDGEGFEEDTLRLKEDVLRIRMQDTSAAAGFPTTDWQISANDAGAGGAERFLIEDLDARTIPFIVEGGAPSSSIHVDDAGRVGFGTATPAEQLEVQGSSDGTAQIRFDDGNQWNVGGGAGDTFTISEVSDPAELLLTSDGDLAISGKVGIGTVGIPADPLLHVQGTGTRTRVEVEETGTGVNQALLLLRKVNGGAPFVRYQSTFRTWDFTGGNFFSINDPGDPAVEFLIDAAGNLTLTGTLTTGSGTVYPDYVFDADYPLLPLDELASYIATHRHLPNVPSAAETAAAGGINMSDLQLRLLEKVEELTLYTLAQQRTLEAQEAAIRELRSQLESLTTSATP